MTNELNPKLPYPDMFQIPGSWPQSCLFDPKIVFHYTEFQKFLATPEYFAQELENLKKYIDDVTGYHWGNGYFRFSNIYGDEFAFQIYPMKFKPGSVDLSVWDAMGGTAIAHALIVPGDPTNEIGRVIKTSEEFTQGIIHCSGCQKPIEYAQVKKQRYFAGIYCDECWNSKYKAIEANENYE